MKPVSIPPRTLVTDRGDAGRRLDLVLRRHLTDLSRATRTRVQFWIEDGRVTVNGGVVRRVSTRVGAGDEVTVALPDEAPRAAVLAEPGEPDRLFEDDHFLVVNKPAGVVSHPTFRHPAGSLLNVLLHYAQNWPGDQRPSLVGRLDKLTSGVIAVAKSTAAHARLQRTLASSRSEKAYLAVAYGTEMPERGTVSLNLRRDPDDRRRVIATQDDGRPSVTQFDRIDAAEIAGCAVALVQCRLVTGRMHQVRVHMSASGWPLVGDPKYGEAGWEQCQSPEIRARLQTFARQALHAWRLSFVHPFTQERIVVEAPLPDDMRDLIQACGLELSPGVSRDVYSRNVSAAPGAVKSTSSSPARPVT
jgi:23S rRNA pseudouridine1911/1915/1917 synthase